MDGLVELGRRSLREIKKHNHFRPSRSGCSIIETRPDQPGQPSSISRIDITESQLRAELEGQSDQGTRRLFELVCIWRDEDEVLHSSQGTFLLVFDYLGLSPAAMYLVSRNCYGFHVLPGLDSRRTFFVGTIMYALVWTYDVETSRTRALLLLRTGCGLTEGADILDELISILDVYKSHLRDPYYLHYIIGLQVSRFVDKSIQVELDFVRKMESSTGYGSWTSGQPSRPQPDVRKLTEWSADIGSSVVNLANQVRHADVPRSLASFIQDDLRSGQFGPRDHTVDPDISVLLPIMDRQAASQLSYIAYLQERAKSLSSVV